MSNIFVSIVFCTLLLDQTDANPKTDRPITVAAEQQKQIDHAVEQLGSRRFAERQKAFRFLQNVGISAEPSLKKAAQSDDPEIRARVKQLLADLRYGISPGTKPDVAVLIRRYRDGTPKERQTAFDRLLKKQEFKILQRIIQLEEQPEIRRQLVERLFKDELVVNRFIELNAIRSLVDTIGRDADPGWRREMIARVLFSPRMLQALIDKEQLGTIEQFLLNEESETTRAELLSLLFQNQAALGTIVTSGQVDFAIQLVTSFEAEKSRERFAQQLLGVAAFPAKMVEAKRLDDLFRFVESNLTKETRSIVLETLFTQSEFTKATLETYGLEKLVALIQREKDPTTRGKLFGRIAVGTTVRTHLSKQGNTAAPIEWARAEKDPVARRAFLDVLFQQRFFMRMRHDAGVLQAMWKIIEEDKNIKWQASALAQVLPHVRTANLFQDEKSIQWILHLIRDVNPQDRSSLLSQIVANQYLRSQLLALGKFEEILTLAREEPVGTRGSTLRSLMSDPRIAQLLQAKGDLQQLLTIAREETDAKSRQDYLLGLFQNPSIMKALVAANHFDATKELIDETTDTGDHALLYATFLSTQAIADEMHNRGQLDSLISYAQMLDDLDARRTYLQQLFRNYHAVRLLVDQEHFDTLLKMANSDPEAAQRFQLKNSLLVNPRVLDHLTTEKQIATLITFVTQEATNNMRSAFLQRIMNHPGVMEAIVNENHFDDLVEIIAAEVQSYRRASLVAALIRNATLTKYLSQQKQLSRLIQLTTSETDQNARRQMLNAFVSNPETLAIWIKTGKLDVLWELFASQKPLSTRAQLLGQLLTRVEVLQKLSEENRLEVVLTSFSNPANKTARDLFAQQLFGNPQAIAYLIEKGHFAALLETAESASSSQMRAHLTSRLLSVPQAIDLLVERGVLVEFLNRIGQDSELKARRQFVSSLMGNQHLLKVLADHQQLQRVFDLIAADKDISWRRQQLMQLMVRPSGLRYLLENKQFESTLDLAISEPDTNRQQQFFRQLFNDSQILDVLAQQGLIDTLLMRLKKEPNQKYFQDFLMAIATSSEASHWLLKQNHFALLLDTLESNPNQAQRNQYLRRIIYQRNVISEAVSAGHLDRLLTLVQNVADPQQRVQILTYFIAIPEVLRLLETNHGKEDTLQRLLGNESEQLRSLLVQQLAQNSLATRELMNRGLFEILVKKLLEEQEVVVRSRNLGQLFASSMIAHGRRRAQQLDWYVEFAKVENQIARREYLKLALQNSTALNALSKNKRLHEIISLWHSETDPLAWRLQLSHLLLATTVIEAFSEDGVLQIHTDRLFQEATLTEKRGFINRLLSHTEPLNALIEKGYYLQICSVIEAETNVRSRQYLWARFLNSESAIRHALEHEDSSILDQLLGSDSDLSMRSQQIRNLLYQPVTIQTIAQCGKIDVVIKAILDLPRKKDQVDLMVRTLATPEVLTYLEQGKNPASLLPRLVDFFDDDVAALFVEQLTENTQTRQFLTKHDHLVALLTMSTAINSSRTRSQAVGNLLADPTVTQTLDENQVLDLFRQFAKQDNGSARRAFLQRALSNDHMLMVLKQNAELTDVLAFSLREPQAAWRSSLLRELLISSAVVEHFGQKQELQTQFESAMEKSLAADQASFLENLISQPATIRAYLKYGMFESLVTTINAFPDASRRRPLLAQIISLPASINYLPVPRMAAILSGLLNEEPNPSQRMLIIRAALVNSEILERLLQQGACDRFLDTFQKIDGTSEISEMATFLVHPVTLRHLASEQKVNVVYQLAAESSNSSTRARLVGELLGNPRVVTFCANHGLADQIPRLIQSGLDEKERENFARRALLNPTLHQELAARSESNTLLKLLEFPGNEDIRQHARQQILYASTGIIPSLLNEDGGIERAQALLDEYATDDLGRARLAAFLLLTGKIDARIQAIQQQLKTEPNADQLRLLTYLSRAKADQPGTLSAARKSLDAVLLRSVLTEQGDWSEAVATGLEDFSQLPVAIPRFFSSSKAYPQIERLGYNASFFRLAKQNDPFAASIAQIVALADSNSTDKQLVFHCAEALLINGEVDKAIQILDHNDPCRAFAICRHQLKFKQALALIDWQGASTISRTWYNKLPALSEKTNGTVVGQFRFALQIAALLRQMGQEENAEKLLDFLELHLPNLPLDRHNREVRTICWGHLCKHLVHLGEFQRAFEAGSRSITNKKVVPSILFNLYGNRGWESASTQYREASSWWLFFQQHAPEISLDITLRKIHDILTPQIVKKDAPDWLNFHDLAAQAVQLADTLKESQHDSYLFGIGATCAKRNENELAEQALRAATATIPDAYYLLGDLLGHSGRWLAAAEIYGRLWKISHVELAALYLQGNALENGEQVKAGQRLKQNASLLAIHSMSRHQLALKLWQLGMAEDATAQWELILKTSPFEHREFNLATRFWSLANEATAENSALAQRWDLYLLGIHRTTFNFREESSYLQIPTLPHRFRAASAIQRGDMETARREMRQSLNFTPLNSDLGVFFVSTLEAAGQSDAATETYQSMWQALTQQCDKYPRSAILHNHTAWLAARCRRDLDMALHHAQRATALTPDKPAFLDTLAEVHFQRGDRETAVRIAKTVLEIAPQNKKFKRRLQHFEHDELPTSIDPKSATPSPLNN